MVYKNEILLTIGEYFLVFINLLLAEGLEKLYFAHHECAKV